MKHFFSLCFLFFSFLLFAARIETIPVTVSAGATADLFEVTSVPFSLIISGPDDSEPYSYQLYINGSSSNFISPDGTYTSTYDSSSLVGKTFQIRNHTESSAFFEVTVSFTTESESPGGGGESGGGESGGGESGGGESGGGGETIDLTNIESSLDQLNTTTQNISNTTQNISNNVSNITSNVSTITNNTTSMAADLSSLESNVTTINNTTQTISNNVSTINNTTQTISNNVSTINNNIASMKSDLIDIKSNVATTATNTTSIKNDISSIKDVITQNNSSPTPPQRLESIPVPQSVSALDTIKRKIMPPRLFNSNSKRQIIMQFDFPMPAGDNIQWQVVFPFDPNGNNNLPFDSNTYAIVLEFISFFRTILLVLLAWCFVKTVLTTLRQW